MSDSSILSGRGRRLDKLIICDVTDAPISYSILATFRESDVQKTISTIAWRSRGEC